MKYLYEHKNQETAKVVEDYPWGFRLRTTIRYWVESKDAKNGGQRFGSQTINPKTGLWCAPKYSTYQPLIIMTMNEYDHVKYDYLHMNSSDEEILLFQQTHGEKLDEFQQKQLEKIVKWSALMKTVKWKVA